MNRATMLAEYQKVLNSNSSFSDWPEVTLLGYLAEGQDKFCEGTGYFTDLSNFAITLQTGVAVYTIPDRVIQILDIWDGTRRLKKPKTGVVYDDDSFYAGTEGPPARWDTDQETGVMRIYPTPTVNENDKVLTLQVWRYSLYDLAGDGPTPTGGGTAPDAEPELPARFQRACIEWAAYKAFNHHDADTQDPVKAIDHLKSFEMYVRDGKAALRRIQNKETRVGSNPAYRT